MQAITENIIVDQIVDQDLNLVDVVFNETPNSTTTESSFYEKLTETNGFLQKTG